MRLPVRPAATLAHLFLLTACVGSGGRGAEGALAAGPGPEADYPVVIGPAFTIEGVTHTPADTFNYDAVGYASAGSEGGDGISAAHQTLPLPSYAELTSLESGRTVLIRLERRGPMNNDHLIELSPGAVAQLGLAGAEKAPVRVRRVNPSEPERALLRSGQRAPERMNTPTPLLAALMRKLNEQVPAVAPAATPTPVPSIAPTPDVAPTAAPAAPATRAPAGGLLVQAGAFSMRERADAVAARIGGRVEQANRLFRVRTGPFASRAEAEAALDKARAAGYSEARILRAD